MHIDMNDNVTNAHEYSVSEISGAIKNCVEDAFSFVRIRGEVGRLSRPASGHIYFDLKDDKSVISAVAWKGVASRWRFQPEQGLEVIVTGRLTTFAGQSKYQIIVENVEPAGVGALMAQLEERRKKLAAEGLFDEGRKKPLPYLPSTIGVITSPSGAVIRDILHRLEDRFPTDVIVWPVRVQGSSCASEVVNAIEGFNALKEGDEIKRPDLIIIARGGGSVEDLWGFNEEIVVRAVADSEIVIISAIGHETDVTLIDYVSDKRAPTPTGAAEIAVPVRADLIAYVDDLGLRQRNGARRLISNYKDRVRAGSAGLPRPSDLLSLARQRLDFALERLDAGLRISKDQKALKFAKISAKLTHPKNLILLARQRLDYFGNRLVGGLFGAKQQKALMLAKVTPRLFVRNLLQQKNMLNDELQKLAMQMPIAFGKNIAEKDRQVLGFAKLLKSLSYSSILQRGFAIVLDENNNLVKTAKSLQAEDLLNIRFADDEVKARVEKEPKPQVKKTTKKIVSKDDNQSSLF
jgi:exodeoxyribonuclease VII large subunit